MGFQQIILLMFMCSFVFGQNSFNHDFGVDFEKVFSSGSELCGSFSPWIQANYDTISVVPPSPESQQFIKPNTTFSCIFSEPFSMSHGGQLRLRVYLSLTSLSDFISVLAFKSPNNVLIGEIHSSLDNSHINSDWTTLNITVKDGETIETFDGFVVIDGRASSDADILVDHIQYLPPSTSSEEGSGDGECDDDNCEPELAQCIYYDFDAFYALLFANTVPICANTEIWVRSISDETSGITPSGVNSMSCTSSPFIYFTRGTLNVTLLIQSESYFDLISVLLNYGRKVLQSVTYGKLISGDITSELYTLEIPVDFEGYAQITFVGFATRGARVLVESFEFMPSLWDNEKCISLWEIP